MVYLVRGGTQEDLGGAPLRKSPCSINSSPSMTWKNKKTARMWRKKCRKTKNNEQNMKGKGSNARALALHVGDGLEARKMSSCPSFLILRTCGVYVGAEKWRRETWRKGYNEKKHKKNPQSFGGEEMRGTEVHVQFLSPHGGNGLQSLQKDVLYQLAPKPSSWDGISVIFLGRL